jgi:hypothetical protein
MSVCILALVTQHAKRWRLITTPSLACMVIHIILHYLIKGTIFVKKFLNLKFVF